MDYNTPIPVKTKSATSHRFPPKAPQSCRPQQQHDNIELQASTSGAMITTPRPFPKSATKAPRPTFAVFSNAKTPGRRPFGANPTAATTPRAFPGSAKTPGSGFVRSRLGSVTLPFNTPVSSTATKKKGSNNIKVAVRCRPLLRKELESGDENEADSVVDIAEDQVVVDQTRPFRFDVHLGHDVDQNRVYTDCVQHLVSKVLEGYNGSVFAYGQTGTGKTYTMGTEAGQYQPTATATDHVHNQPVAEANDGHDCVADNDNFNAEDVETSNSKDCPAIEEEDVQIEDTDNVQNKDKVDSNTETDDDQTEKDKMHFENVQGLDTITEESSDNEDSQIMETEDDIDHNASTEDNDNIAATLEDNDENACANEAGQIEDNVGIIPRVIKEIFSKDSNISVKVSFYEILNEQVFDLLNPSKQRVPLNVREIPQEATFKISQLTQEEAHSVDEAMFLLKQGTSLRTTESTVNNEASSRSHAVFTLTISSEARPEDIKRMDLDDETEEAEDEDSLMEDTIITRKLNLVDLAGSEAVGSMNSLQGIRTQGISINKGLLSLGNVVRALAERKGHIPYRDSVLTKVLKESLAATSFISMIACISPARSDLYETMNTLRFANRAKELVSKPVPAFMLQQQANSSSKKRKYDGGLGEGTTPKPRFNHTIGTPTPSKTKKHNLAGYKRQLNLTAPEKRYPTSATSTLSKMAEESPDATLSNLSGISMIKGPEEDVSMMSTSSRPQDYSDESMMRGGAGVWGMEQTNVENKTLNMTDISALMSPMMRQMKETIEKSVKEGIAQYQQQQNQPKESALVLDITPPRKAKNTPRMTSSPIRRTPLRKAAMTPSRTSAMTSSQHTLGGGINERIDETDGVLKDVTNAALFSDDEEMVKTDIKASNITNDKQINAIPEIPEYESPASTARNPQQPQIQQQPQQIQAQQPQIHNIQQQLNYSPTIEEMERSLGIGPDSPLALFCGPSTDNFNPPPPRPPGERKKSRRSTRRTSVFGSELEQSLQFIRNSTADIRARRMSNIRPTRAAAQGVFYGSPKSRKDKENTDVVVPESVTEPSNVVQHPLFNKNAFTVDPARQRAHNDSILTLLNTGSLKLLTALPAIGPKTGCILHGYRTLNGGIKTIQEIETINGLGQKFYKKFLIQNQIVLDEETSV